MKRPAALTLCLLTLPLPARPAAAKPRPTPTAGQRARSELDARISRVKARVAELERSLPTTRVEKTLHGCGASGGALTAWVEGKRVAKIEARLFAAEGEIDRIFWFERDGKLLYARIDGPKAPRAPEDGEEREPPTPSEFYFEKGSIFRWTSGPSSPSPEEMTATAEELTRGIWSDDPDLEC